MNESFIFNLKQPCKNRNIELTNNGDGTVTIHGNKFETMKEVEDYLEAIPRKDMK